MTAGIPASKIAAGGGGKCPKEEPIDLGDMAIVHRTLPSAESGEALAESLDQLNSVSQHHLDDEEQKVVPLAAVTLSQPEWDAVEKHTVAEIPRNKRPVAFGMVLDPLNETDREFMLMTLPRPVRMARES